jgi:putative ABC transport system substrate-binding protein
MRRREFVTLLSGAAAFNPLFAWAQQSPSPLIGVLEGASALSTTKNHEAFRAGLRQLGYVEGRTIRLEYRYADGFLDRLPNLAAERSSSIRRSSYRRLCQPTSHCTRPPLLSLS